MKKARFRRRRDYGLQFLQLSAPAKWRNGLLLVASYVFYASWGKRFCVLLLGLTVLVYAAGLLLGQKKRRWLFWLGLGGTLGALLVYKYLDFGLYSINALTRALGLGEPMPRVSLLQPAGISFFTFQAAGYLIDVYKGKYERPKKADFDALRRGFLTMTWGFFLKLCIADRAAVLVNTVYGAFESYSGIFLVFATAVYALQIYGDFAGYSYMAIGGAEMLGIHLPKNFDTPYFAQSVQEFWRRWHISLSTWFRDYVYIPLGGSRCAAWKKYRNVFIVFLVSGLWHGALWTFVLWGAIHGFYQIFGAVTKPLREKALDGLRVNRQAASYKLFRMVITFALVDFAWLFFRAEGLDIAAAMVKRIVTGLHPEELPEELVGQYYTMGLDPQDFWALLLCTAVLLLVDGLQYRGKDLKAWFASQNWLFRELALAVILLTIFIFGIWGNGFDASSFIYFKF